MGALLEKAKSLGMKPYSQLDKQEKIQYHQAIAKKFKIEADKAENDATLSSVLTRGAKKVTGALGLDKASDTIANSVAHRTATKEQKQYVPSNTKGEKIGAALQIGSLLAPVGTAARAVGGVVGKVAGNILAGAGTGYAIDVGANLSDGKTGTEALKPGVGTLVGPAIPGASAVSGGLKNMVKNRAVNSIESSVGRVLQGETKDIQKGLSALKSIDTKGVKKFSQLSGRIGDKIRKVAEEVDAELLKESGSFKIGDLTSTMKSKSGKVVSTNFVENGLRHLSELYDKTGDAVAKANVDEIIAKANESGLSRKEINDIAREYGQEFGKKAFNKVGDALTSVNAQLYENTRKGLKSVARDGISGKVAKEKDTLLSNLINTQKLIDKNVESVARLAQKAEDMGLGRKAVRGVVKMADTLTLGGFRALRETLIQSNVGKKTMNWLDVEEQLQKNLKKIEGATKKLERVKTGKDFNAPGDFLFEKMKKIRPGMNLQDVSGGKPGYSDPFLQLTPAQKRSATLAKKQSEKEAKQVAEGQKMVDNGPNAKYEAKKNRATTLAKSARSFEDFLKNFKKPNVKVLKQIFLDAKNSKRHE